MAEQRGTTSLLDEGTEGAAGGQAGGGAPQLPGWLAGLPRELQEIEWLRGFPKPGDFAKAALALKERADKSIQPLGQNATETERQAYFKALGVPDNEDGYTFDPKKLPAGMEQNAELTAHVKKIAKEANLTQAQAQGLYIAMHARAGEALGRQQEEDRKAEAEAKAAIEKNEAALRKSFGNDFDARIKAAGKAGRDLAQLAGIKPEEWNAWLKELELDKELNLILALDALAQHVKPDQLVRGASGIKPANEARPTGLSYPWMRQFYGTPPE